MHSFLHTLIPIEPIWRLNIRVWAIRNINQTDVTWSYGRLLTWSGVEISIGITCACLPPPTLSPSKVPPLLRQDSRQLARHKEGYTRNWWQARIWWEPWKASDGTENYKRLH